MSSTMIAYTYFDTLLRNLNWEQPQPCWLSSQACAFEHLRRFGLEKVPILTTRLDWLQSHQS
jgi:hypothetical protein